MDPARAVRKRKALSRILLDTNVLVYSLDRSENEKRQVAVGLLKTLVTEHEILLSAQILGEFFCVTTRKIAVPLSCAEAQDLVAKFSSAWKVFPIDTDVVQRAVAAVQRHSLSYWDAQLCAVAHLHRVDVILSEDLQDGATYDGVRVFDPFQPGFRIERLREKK